MTAKIAICLATFNGARFLPEQLQSIAMQSHADWHLYVRDDNSSDGSAEILSDFAFCFPDRVTIIQDDRGRLGAQENFACLMETVNEPYIAFADQDDIWRPQKLARSFAQLRKIERNHGPDIPAMVHADRLLIDASGREIASSYWQSRGIRPAQFTTVENHYNFCLAAGSTMLINRPLMNLSLPVPTEARMYDCWIELVAHGLGVVDWLDDIALDHRRHGANASGSAQDNNSAAARRPIARAARLLRNLQLQQSVYARYMAQASAFRLRFHSQLATSTLRLSLIHISEPTRLC